MRCAVRQSFEITMFKSYVAVIDLGSRRNLGWAIDGPHSSEGKCIEKFIQAAAKALRRGPLALGFEAPMFVPFHQDSQNLTRGRRGDHDRAFSASAGSSVLVTGLVTIPYILASLRKCAPRVPITFNWRKPYRLLLFEAFVTHQGKRKSDRRHVEDAHCAIRKFREGMRTPRKFESAITEPIVFNLLGAALLRTGWTASRSVLGEPCLVVRHRGDKSSKRKFAKKSDRHR
jgi:hypothetical protein